MKLDRQTGNMILEIVENNDTNTNYSLISKEGKDLLIGFNPKFLIDALRVIEDEEVIADLERDYLELSGFEVEIKNNGKDGLSEALKGDCSLVILDLMLPEMDGFEVCKRIREERNIPIIMVSAKKEDIDKIRGLGLGADDYMTKPFSLGELISRIKANIRRYSGEAVVRPAEEAVKEEIIQLDELEINLSTYSVKKNGVEISLSKQQYELLVFLAKNRGKKYRQEALLKEVWGYDDYYGEVRTVDVTVTRLRKQIEDNPSEPKYIKNKRGMGYYID